jgi:hypothetical protein
MLYQLEFILIGQTDLNSLIAFKGCKFQVLPIHPASRQLS